MDADVVVVDSTGDNVAVAAAVVTSVVVADVGLSIDHTVAVVDSFDPIDFALDSTADLDIDTIAAPTAFVLDDVVVVVAAVHLLLHRLNPHLHLPTTYLSYSHYHVLAPPSWNLL